jgi:hypothetical protein
MVNNFLSTQLSTSLLRYHILGSHIQTKANLHKAHLLSLNYNDTMVTLSSSQTNYRTNMARIQTNYRTKYNPIQRWLTTLYLFNYLLVYLGIICWEATYKPKPIYMRLCFSLSITMTWWLHQPPPNPIIKLKWLDYKLIIESSTTQYNDG